MEEKKGETNHIIPRRSKLLEHVVVYDQAPKNRQPPPSVPIGAGETVTISFTSPLIIRVTGDVRDEE